MCLQLTSLTFFYILKIKLVFSEFNARTQYIILPKYYVLYVCVARAISERYQPEDCISPKTETAFLAPPQEPHILFFVNLFLSLLLRFTNGN